MLKSLTRLLAFSAVLTLASASGSELLAAEEESSSAEQVVQFNTDFAIDLYRQLAKENAGENLFFSPYSVSVALTMVAEGARGETASQMGQVLRFPDSARREGADAEGMPWETASIHRGIGELNRLFNRDEEGQRKLRDEIATVRQQHAKLGPEMSGLETEKKWNQYDKLAAKQRELAGQLDRLRGQIDSYELRVANALWAEKTYPFKDEYLTKINRLYEAGGLRPVDFKNNPERHRQEINAWAEEQTNERIKDLIPEGMVDSTTRLVLANAIYFKGDWIEPFSEKESKPAAFTTADGKKVETPLMQKQGMTACRYGAFQADGTFFSTPTRTSAGDKQPKYPAAGGFALVELPYQGEDLSMVVLLPTEAGGLEDLEKRLTSAALDQWIGQLKKRKVNVLLPKFKAETEYKLNDTLKSMGMVRAFVDPFRDPKNGAQFDGMSHATNPMDKLYISFVQHKAFVEVNEKGTEAAAATAVGMGVALSMPRDWPFIPTFKADHPFIYLIRDVQSGSVLFLGRLLTPAT